MGLTAADVTACLVTRGDVDMRPIIESLPFSSVVWDNSAASEDLAVYGRYAAIRRALKPVIYVQDDDCLLAPDSFDALLDAYEPGHVVCNMPHDFRYQPQYLSGEHALVGFGALFDRDLPAAAFARLGRVDDMAAFRRSCDIYFTALTPRILVDVPHTDLPYASGPGRMWTTPGHVEERSRALAHALQVRDAVAA